jgi:GDPmannose 4,6-dehydratase
MEKTALIFGITGQDGSYLAELLLDKGYRVFGVARRVSVDTTQRISHILPKINMIEGDITDQFCVSNIIAQVQPDEIYNLAAQSHVGTSFRQPSLTWEITAGGCLNILESIRSLDLCNKVRFYQASSSEMFGRNFDTRTYPLKDGETQLEPLKYQDENTRFQPQSPYAIAKLAAHYLVDNYRTSYGLYACSGILFNHESERRGDQFVTRKITKWIGEWYNAENKDEIPPLALGNLEARRDWGHAQDYVEAMWLMLQQDDPDDYVVATYSTHSVRDFLDAAFKCVGVDDWNGLVVQDPKFYRPAEVEYLLGKPTNAERQLGWRPKIPFEELVKRMVENDINEARL